MTNDWTQRPVQAINQAVMQVAGERQNQLTKPPGALGQLEQIAIRLAGMQGVERPRADRVHISIFAADHGIAAQAVSAFPQAVTVEMVRNFAHGGAAISVLARELGATLEVVNCGTVTEIEPLAGVIDSRVGAGTADFLHQPAMSQAQLDEALAIGCAAALRASAAEAQLFIGGEMGIANTSAASAVASALLDLPAEALAGPGTGLGREGISHKARVLNHALALHRPHIDSPLEAMRRVGGFELAALTGTCLACAQLGIPVLVDGFIASAAALVAVRHQPAVADWLLLAHASAEPGHQYLVQAFGQTPILDLGMRLGEGSGAACAVPTLRLACALHNGMATFAEAAISGKC